ncbi:cytochrome P460 family protein [Haliangium ochraceum]|nr:cytochrome P460 family protein [Haliangium ochraceum]
MRALTKLAAISCSGLLFLGACGDDGGGTDPDIDAGIDAGDIDAGDIDAGGDGAAALWAMVSDYATWDEFPNHGGVVAYQGHGAEYRQVFVNDTAKGDLAAMPDGSIIVKTNLTADDATAVAAITVMMRDGDDWVWARFDPSGTDDVYGTTDELNGMGCVAGACHGDMDGTDQDYVFLNNDAQAAGAAYAEMTAAGAEYDTFDSFFGNAVEIFETVPAHGDYARVYVNETGADDSANLPMGSLIVKENLKGADENNVTLDSYTIMQKIAEDDDESKNWLFAKLTTEGKVTVASTPEQLGDNGCTRSDCHGSMQGTGSTGGDYVFGNN